MTGRRSRKRRLSVDQIAFGMVLGVIALLATAQLYEVWFGAQAWTAVQTASPAILALLIALISLLMSYRMFVEQRIMRQAGTDPVVLVHLGQRRDAPMLITLNVSNVGAGAALNVSLKPRNDQLDDLDGRIMTHPKDITHPIRVIRQNDSVAYPLGAGYKLLGDTPLAPFTVDVTYEDIEGVEHSDTMTIDVRELEHQSANKDPDALIADTLGKMEATMKKGAAAQKPLAVVTETRKEYQDRLREEREEMKRVLEKRKQS